MAQAKGKILLVDRSSEDMNADNIYNMNVNALYYYNSSTEGDINMPGALGAKAVNKPEVVDLGMSSAISELLRFLQFIDINIANITGITGSRKGELKSDTGLGQMEQASLASSMSTQPYFTVWYTVAGQVIEKLCEQMGRTWAGKEVTKYFLGDDGYEVLNLMSASEWNLDRYGISIENGANDMVVKNQIYQLAQALMPIQNEPEMARVLVKMINSNSAKEAERIFDKGIDALGVVKKKIAESEQQQAVMQQQLQKEIEDNKALREKIKVSGEIQGIQIQSETKLKDTQMKLNHKSDTQTVKKQDTIDLMLAEKALEDEPKNKFVGNK